VTEHDANCFPDDRKSAMMSFKEDLKTKALSSSDGPARVRANALAEMGTAAEQISFQGRSQEADKKIVQRFRQKNKEPTFKDPETLDQVPREFFNTFGSTSRGEQFLLHDDGPEADNRIVIFASPRGLNRILLRSRFW